MLARLTSRLDDGARRDVLVWPLDATMLVASSALVGGGLGAREWVLNAEVAHDYHRIDVQEHVAELAAVLELSGEGVGMLTAARVRDVERSSHEGVDVEVTVGLSHPTWAAGDDATVDEVTPGTINVVAFFPVQLHEGALVNAVMTATEAKSQALWEAGIAATGTPSDAVTILCPLEGDAERFAGPRSMWGSRLARAVLDATLAGAHRSLA